MTINLPLTPDERFALMSILRAAINRARADDWPAGYAIALLDKIAETPCGNPGCLYCDPHPEDFEDKYGLLDRPHPEDYPDKPV